MNNMYPNEHNADRIFTLISLIETGFLMMGDSNGVYGAENRCSFVMNCLACRNMLNAQGFFIELAHTGFSNGFNLLELRQQRMF